MLRREAKDVDGWVWTLGTGGVALAMFLLMAAWAAALHRLASVTPRAAATESAASSPPAVLAGT